MWINERVQTACSVDCDECDFFSVEWKVCPCVCTVLDSPDVFRIEERAQHGVDEAAPIGSTATIWQAHARQGAEIWWFLFRWTASCLVFFVDMIRSLMVFISSPSPSPKDVGAEESCDVTRTAVSRKLVSRKNSDVKWNF